MTTALCSETSCQRPGEIPCGYGDETGARCPTHWCSEHVVTYFGEHFCTRHASAVAAIGENAEARPAVDDRGASLAHWVASDLDEMVRNVLDRARDQFGESILTGPVRPAGDVDDRSWQRTWWLQGESGLSVRVSIGADNRGEPEVTAHVDSEVVDRAVPPWIAHRIHGDEVSHVQDRAERQEFEQRLATAIQVAVESRRPLRADTPVPGQRPTHIPPPVT
jgi:hypothetical protein